MSNNLLQTNTVPIGAVPDTQVISSPPSNESQTRVDVSEPIQVLINSANLAQRRGACTLNEASAINEAITKIANIVNGKN